MIQPGMQFWLKGLNEFGNLRKRMYFYDMKKYIEKNRERFYAELFSLLRIPSVSAKPEHKNDMYACAERLKALLLEAGADTTEVCPTSGNPVVFGAKQVDPKARTVLVYGHYDVQPAEPLEKWRTDPFEPVIGPDPATGEEAIWCRGANDDKGQLFMHIKAFEYLLREGKLRHNVKFIFEGEEEIGSPSLPAWVAANKEKLAADVILVSDTTMISDKVPSINCGMRGLSYVEITVTGPNKDLHSGHYGGAVANPITTLCEMIATLHDADGRVNVPGFYDDVVELSAADRANLARAPFDMEEYKQFLDIAEAIPRLNAPASARAWMSAASGAATPAPAPRRSCPRRPTPNSPCGWCPTRTAPASRNNSSLT